VGDKRPTSADVAIRAGVSRTTVSVVLNGRNDIHISPATRQRVFDAATSLGYHPSAPARQLVHGRSHIVGLVLRQTEEQIAADVLLGETLRGLSAAARTADYRVLVEALPPEDGRYQAVLRSRHADGLIVSGPRDDDVELEGLIVDGLPIVIQGALPGLAVPSVDVDNIGGARTAVDHLVSLGRSPIACITNAPLTYTAAAERLAGWRESVRRAGLTDGPELVAEGGFDAPSGRRAMRTLLDAGFRSGGLFVASDVVALGAIAAIRESGLTVPDDVSVVGFDDIALAAHFDPPFTTIRIPAFDLGLVAGRALLDRIAGRDVPDRTLLPTELIVRSSATAPRSTRRRPSGPSIRVPAMG
jgi:LacI family transcriptional regulator